MPIFAGLVAGGAGRGGSLPGQGQPPRPGVARPRPEAAPGGGAALQNAGAGVPPPPQPGEAGRPAVQLPTVEQGAPQVPPKPPSGLTLPPPPPRDSAGKPILMAPQGGAANAPVTSEEFRKWLRQQAAGAAQGTAGGAGGGGPAGQRRFGFGEVVGVPGLLRLALNVTIFAWRAEIEKQRQQAADREELARLEAVGRERIAAAQGRGRLTATTALAGPLGATTLNDAARSPRPLDC